MRYREKSFLLLFITCVFVTSCSAFETREETRIEVRYMNLRAVADALASDDIEWKNISVRSKDLKARMREMDKMGDKSLQSERKLVTDEIESLMKKEDGVRKRLYPLIERAIRDVARRNNVKIVFNTSDGVLYADERYDITGEVLSEARSIRMRNDSLSR
jgi:Skp family chaperone for outer membrane proteins